MNFQLLEGFVAIQREREGFGTVIQVGDKVKSVVPGNQVRYYMEYPTTDQDETYGTIDIIKHYWIMYVVGKVEPKVETSFDVEIQNQILSALFDGPRSQTETVSWVKQRLPQAGVNRIRGMIMMLVNLRRIKEVASRGKNSKMYQLNTKQ